MELCELCMEESEKLVPVPGRFLVCEACAVALEIPWWDR